MKHFRKGCLSLVLSLLLVTAVLTGCGNTADETAVSDTEVSDESTDTSDNTDNTSNDESEAAGDTASDSSTEESSEDAASYNTADSTATDSSEVTYDRAGNEITLPDEIDTIISMAPSTTQVLMELGLADKIVAIDTNSYDFIEMLGADVQVFDMMAPDNEALIALEPDIIFTSGMSNVGGEDAYQAVRDAGICVADIPSSESFDAIAEDILFIGQCVQAEESAQTIVDDMYATIADISEKAANVSEAKTILFMISLPTADYPTVYTVGSGTYINEMIETIGAVNVCSDQESWIGISEEDAIALNPDVIITNVNYVDNAVDTIKTASGWESVTAVQNGDVYYIDANASSRPNEHVVDAMQQMAEYVYPDVYMVAE